MKERMSKPTRWYVSHHEKKRVKQRFNIGYDSAYAWVNAKMKHASYVSDIIDENGDPARLYASKGVNFVVDLTKNKVITVMEPRNQTAVNVKLRKFASQELTKVLRKETRSLRKIEALRAVIEMEIGEQRARLLRARSLPTKIAIQARMKALKMRLDELPAEEFEVRRDKTRTATALAKVL